MRCMLGRRRHAHARCLHAGACGQAGAIRERTVRSAVLPADSRRHLSTAAASSRPSVKRRGMTISGVVAASAPLTLRAATHPLRHAHPPLRSHAPRLLRCARADAQDCSAQAGAGRALGQLQGRADVAPLPLHPGAQERLPGTQAPSCRPVRCWACAAKQRQRLHSWPRQHAVMA